jgi:hypothetical protein
VPEKFYEGFTSEGLVAASIAGEPKVENERPSEAGGEGEFEMAESVRGIEVQGTEPKQLKLSDGSRLWLEAEPIEHGRVEWMRADPGGEPDGDPVSLDEALDIAGDEFASYVAVRTRAEAEWMRVVAEWYRERADELARDLAGAER